MTNIETGESFDLGDVSEASLTVDIDKCDISPQFEYPKKFPPMVDLLIPEIVQVRKHKKKRINKKWAKRYGYKQIMRKSKGWKIKIHCEDNTFELVKDGDSV